MSTADLIPVKVEDRIAFDVEWYESEEKAIRRAGQVPVDLLHSKSLGRSYELDIRGGPGNALLFAVKVPRRTADTASDDNR